jgi:hypothetical protein
VISSTIASSGGMMCFRSVILEEMIGSNHLGEDRFYRDRLDCSTHFFDIFLFIIKNTGKNEGLMGRLIRRLNSRE